MRRKSRQAKIEAATNGWPTSPTSSISRLHSKTFGAFLRQQRLARGLSRSVLAGQTGVAEARLAKIELNQAVPSCASIRRLAPILDVPEDALMEAAGYLTRSQSRAG
jgi:ribosome-binding protein aMBF1 (putative translation factor)